MNEKQRIRVAAALIEREERYLITRRKEGVHLEGLWEFPGGKCEAGESFESCIHREIFEELGIEITPPHLFMALQHDYPELTVELNFFSCSIHQGEPKAWGCAEFCWVRVEEMCRLAFPPADVPVINQLAAKAVRSV